MTTLLAVLAAVALQSPPQEPAPKPKSPAETPATAADGAVADAKQAKPRDELEALAEQVQKAHHPNGPIEPIRAFRGHVELHLLDASAEQRGQIDLAVQFLEWKRPGSDTVRPLLRYEVQEAGRPVLRGNDRNGPWQLFQGKPEDLTQAQFQNDLEQCERHVNLARQLLQFLEPAKVLRSLTRVSAVGDEPLLIERGVRVDCRTVEGDVPAFPLLQQPGEQQGAHVKIYVDQKTGQLLAIDAWPSDKGKMDATRGERVLLLDLQPRDGLLVPHELKHLFRGADGKLRLHSRAVLTELSLRPKLEAKDFDRPKS